MKMFFQNNTYNTYFAAMLGPFFLNLGKNEFSWKKGFVGF